MRLLMTADAIGGVWTYAAELAAALTPMRVEVTVAVLGPPASPFPGSAAPSLSHWARERARSPRANGKGEGLAPAISVIETGLPLDWLCDGPAPVRAAAGALAGLASKVQADLVHLNSPALAAAARWPAPVVAVEHGSVAPWWEAAHPGEPLPAPFAWHEGMVRDGLLAADAAVAPTAAYASAVRARYGLRRPPLAVHNGRTPAALPDGGPANHAFTAGRLWDRVKRTALLDQVAALTPIRAAGPVAGPHGEAVVCDHLDLAGALDEAGVAAELGRRPVFVSAAVFEPFGLAVLEAAQAGCPLVLSDIAAFRELWDDAALFVASDEPRDWAHAIARARADRDTLGAAARARAARYTSAATASAMRAIYDKLLGGRRAAA